MKSSALPGQVSSGMSHDDFAHELRTPLTAIRGAIDLLTLRESLKDDPAAEALLRLAQRNVERLLLAVENAIEENHMKQSSMQSAAAWSDGIPLATVPRH